MGAWIETELTDEEQREFIVAPCVGAWIETCTGLRALCGRPSHPAWVRGLKLNLFALLFQKKPSHPAWVRGLKQNAWINPKNGKMSHPAWVRGLKPANEPNGTSLPCRTLRGCVD